MAFDPEKHHRRSIRLPRYDYRRPGLYFVTICVNSRRCLFGRVIDGVMRLNDTGRIAHEEWLRTAELRANVAMDAYVIMPNHVHGVIQILGDPPMHRVPTDHPTTPTPLRTFGQPVAHSLSTIVAMYKAAVTRRVNRLRGTPGQSLWQSRFYEHIVRDARDLARIRRYIAMNPQRWHVDRNRSSH